jgi:hypothetical protein
VSCGSSELHLPRDTGPHMLGHDCLRSELRNLRE